MTVTTRKNYDVLRGSKLEHHVFRRTGVIIRVSACDLREQVLCSSSVCYQQACPSAQQRRARSGAAEEQPVHSAARPRRVSSTELPASGGGAAWGDDEKGRARDGGRGRRKRWAQDGPRCCQDSLREPPLWRQDGRRAFQKGSRWPEDGPR